MKDVDEIFRAFPGLTKKDFMECTNEFQPEDEMPEGLREALNKLESNGSEPPKYQLSGRNIADFLDLKIEPATNLLGNRWLTKGSGAFLIAPSGHGKSSISIQLLISFAVGRVVFGIKPPRALRILCAQSEDDDAETKKFAQVIRKMKLTQEELELLKRNTRLEHRNNLTGSEFIKALDDWLTEWPADLVIINPVTGFFLADLKDEEKVAFFLRGQLNSILTKHGCAAFIVHHTPKTNFTKLENMQWYDWMYVMSGCASLTNWARAVLVLAPSKIPGTYRLIAAKRFDEIGWTDREYWFSHSKETSIHDGESVEIISWIPAKEEQISAAKPTPKQKKKIPDLEEVWKKMSPLEEYSRVRFEQWCRKEFGLGEKKAWSILQNLCDEGLAQVSEEKRPGTNPLKKYRKILQPASANGSLAID